MSRPAPGSALARLKAARQEAGATVDRHLDVLVPGTEDVYLRLGYLEPEAIEKAAKAVSGKRNRPRTGDTFRHNVAVLVEACRGVFTREADGTAVSLDPDKPSADPADWPRIGPRLGELLGVSEPDATSVLLALLGDSWAVQAVAARYNEWLIPTTEELDEDHQGE